LQLQIKYGDYTGKILIPADFKKVLSEIARKENKKLGEICFIFVSGTEILRINREYLRHDYLTDVITFDNSTKRTLNGDIFVCPEIVFENAEDYHAKGIHELFRVMIHGVLHLAGYGDATKEEKQVMRQKEDFFLKGLPE
jgi:probable rRNA maturation factor